MDNCELHNMTIAGLYFLSFTLILLVVFLNKEISRLIKIIWFYEEIMKGGE